MSNEQPEYTGELIVPDDAVPGIVRTIAYYAALVTGPVAGVVTAVVAATAPEHVPAVGAIAVAVVSAVATVAGGLGVVYRPRRLADAG